MPEPNTDGAAAGEALEGLPGSKSVARAAEAARNQGDPEGSRRTNYEGQAGRGAQRQEERPEARQGVGFVHSSPWQGDRLAAGEGTNKLTKPAQATRCRKNDGSTLANLPAGDTQRVSLKSPVRYVLNLVMWYRGRSTLDLLGFGHSQHHIIFCTQTILRTPIGPFWFARRVARREITRE
jgi:hypothetical protein